MLNSGGTLESTSKLSRNKIEIIAIGLLIVGAIAAIVGLSVFAWQQQKFVASMKADTSLLGNLGSFLSGTVGATWSLAGVILFYLALKEQRKDIKINQAALNLQIRELEDTRMVYVEQSNTFKTQGFENTFFQLLQLHSNAVNELSYSPNGHHDKLINGKSVFVAWKIRLDYFAKGETPESIQDGFGYWKTFPSIAYKDFGEVHNALNTKYRRMYLDFENTLSHYFRQLYHIFKYIHMSTLIPSEKKAFYSSLVRAQLSQNELYALLFNSLVEGYGSPKFIFLIKQYNLLKNFNPDGIPDPIIWNYFNNKVVVDPYLGSEG